MLNNVLLNRSPILRSALLACSALWTAAFVDGAELQTASADHARSFRVYLASYGNNKDQGVYLAEFNVNDGKLCLVGCVASLKNALYIALHPSHRYLYVACDVGGYADSDGAGIAAFAIEPSKGSLRMLNMQSSAGAVPCHLEIDRQAQRLFVCNYRGGNVAVLPINSDGKLDSAVSIVRRDGSSVNKGRQEASHPHALSIDEAGQFAFVSDLGLDEIACYRVDAATGTLLPNTPAALSSEPGAGPRYFTFHPNGRSAYGINELNNTISLLDYDSKKGVLALKGAVTTLPNGEAIDSIAADIALHPSGRFLYGSNRGNDTIAMFAIDQLTGELTSLGHHPAGGRTPISMAIDPTGTFLLSANQDSDNIVVHHIDPHTGTLSETNQKIRIKVPVCIQFVP